MGKKKTTIRAKPKRRTAPAKLEMAVVLLAAGHSARSVAKRLRVSRATVAAWKDDPDTAGRIANESADIAADIHGEFMQLRRKAVKCIENAMDDTKAVSAAGVRAALEVLRVTGISTVPEIPQQISELYRGKTIEVRFTDPRELAPLPPPGAEDTPPDGADMAEPPEPEQAEPEQAEPAGEDQDEDETDEFGEPAEGCEQDTPPTAGEPE